MWQLPKLTPEEILYYLRKSQSDDPLLTVEETLSKHEQMLDEWVERTCQVWGLYRHRIGTGKSCPGKP